MTENLAAIDAYLREADGVVAEVGEGGLVLDRTVFYARGGGQPGDTGQLTWDGGSATVTDTFYKDGAHFHAVDGAMPPVGTAVHGAIDWERRHTLMRTHTALHVLSAIIFRDFDAKVTGGNMEPGAARMDFELDSISVEFGEQVETALDAELAKNHDISVQFLPRQEALADPELIRTKVNLIPGKYKQLIGLAVHSYTHCHYCTLFHTAAAKLNGATDDEIQEAVHFAKHTAGWSTYLNGLRQDYDQFAAELAQIGEFVSGKAG